MRQLLEKADRMGEFRWAVRLVISALGLFLAGHVVAQDRNPWAVPDQRGPSVGQHPPTDGRFVAPDYDPTQERRARVPGSFRPAQPGISWGPSWSASGGLYAPPAPGAPDAGRAQVPWSPDPHWAPGLSAHPGLLPYSGYPGSSILYPGTGLTGLGLLSPLYGAPLGGLPLFGLPY